MATTRRAVAVARPRRVFGVETVWPRPASVAMSNLVFGQFARRGRPGRTGSPNRGPWDLRGSPAETDCRAVRRRARDERQRRTARFGALARRLDLLSRNSAGP